MKHSDDGMSVFDVPAWHYGDTSSQQQQEGAHFRTLPFSLEMEHSKAPRVYSMNLDLHAIIA